MICWQNGKAISKSYVIGRDVETNQSMVISDIIVKEIWDLEREKMIILIENLKEMISRKKEMMNSFLIDIDKLYNLFVKCIID